jgi:hypothetical protein
MINTEMPNFRSGLLNYTVLLCTDMVQNKVNVYSTPKYCKKAIPNTRETARFIPSKLILSFNEVETGNG